MLKDSIEAMIEGYHQYNAYFLNQWHILNSSSIVPTKAMKAYSEHEHNVMCYEEPIYTLVAYIPCYYLWPWFSYQIMQSLDYAPGVYEEWFSINYKGEESYASAKKIKQCI